MKWILPTLVVVVFLLLIKYLWWLIPIGFIIYFVRRKVLARKNEKKYCPTCGEYTPSGVCVYDE